MRFPGKAGIALALLSSAASWAQAPKLPIEAFVSPPMFERATLSPDMSQVAVLVNRESASASEIVTGALQDRNRATVVGTHTFGKGVFQEIKTLSNGGALDITVGEYFTPSGRNLGGGGPKRGAGITPDVKALDNRKTKRDEALDVAVRTAVRGHA